jgi:DNA-binding NtrC family response regulator
MDNCRVLIIEDDESARRQLAKLVTKEGFEVMEAEDGAGGLEMFKEHGPDIIITDFSLPKMDGLELIHKVKRLSPNVQIILVTAFGGDDVAMMALQNGVLDYLKKPIDVDALVVALGRAKEKIDQQKRTALFPSLLLAEDETATRERLARLLEGEGWKVFKAADGEEALKLFQDVKIDIAILDIRMPHKDGLAVLKEMRDISDDFEAIILTGFGNEDSAIKAMRSGAINFIRKPIDIDHLLVSVEKAIEKLRLTRALKYRDRELEIQKEFFAYINKNKEIVVNIGTHFNKQIEIFAKQLLDSIPMAIFVVNKEFTILTYNRDLRKILDGKDQTLNEDFVSKLAKAGGHNIAYDELISRINKVFEQPSGTFERMEIGKYGYIHMSLIKVVKTFKGEKSDVVVVAIRGERS